MHAISTTPLTTGDMPEAEFVAWCDDPTNHTIFIGGTPKLGEPSLLTTIVGHAAIDADTALCLMDGRQAELRQWNQLADVYIGHDLTHAVAALKALRMEIDTRLTYLRTRGRRVIRPVDPFGRVLLAIDEIAYYSTYAGDWKLQQRFALLVRDVIARGRAVGINVAAATERPTLYVFPPSLRDLFPWRFAARCTADLSSNIVLGQGWAERGYSYTAITADDDAAGYLIGADAPVRVPAGYLTRLSVYQGEVSR